MLKRWLVFSILGVMLSGGAAMAKEFNHKVIFGLHEEVAIPELGLQLEAKLDTGAVSASLSAYDIETFTKDDEEWVRFRLGVESDEGRKVELPVDKTVRIRRRKEDVADNEKTYSERIVVRLKVCIGGREVPMRVNLADRRHFNFPLLVGSEGLRDIGALVDASLEFAAGSPHCKK